MKYLMSCKDPIEIPNEFKDPVEIPNDTIRDFWHRCTPARPAACGREEGGRARYHAIAGGRERAKCSSEARERGGRREAARGRESTHATGTRTHTCPSSCSRTAAAIALSDRACVHSVSE